MSIGHVARRPPAAPRHAWGVDLALPLRRLLPPGLLALGLVALLSSNGGYFPVSWGWSALLAFWTATLALLVGSDRRPSTREAAYIGALVSVLCWTVLSAAWSAGPTQVALEGQRVLVYVGGVSATLLVWRRLGAPVLVGSILAAVAVTCSYALATRLFPDRIGFYDAIAGYRLSAPVGYWNGLGIVAVMGTLLAASVATGTGGRLGRASAGATLPLLAVVGYFTFSRGAVLALIVGLAAAIVVDPGRLGLAAKLVWVAVAPAAAVALAYRSAALTRPRSDLAAAAHDGHRLAAWVALLCALSAGASLVLPHLERSVRLSEQSYRLVGWAVAAVVAAAVALATAQQGGPQLAERAYHSFTAKPPPVQDTLNKRLFTFSSNGRIPLWRTAWRDSRAHPWLGSGAGSFERVWLAHRDRPMKVRDAHSLYLETLAELGPVGLALLCAMLLLPLSVVRRLRRRRGVPLIAGAYTAFLCHAGLDWDWELTGVTLTALLVGAALLVEARAVEAAPPLRVPHRWAGAAVAFGLSAVALSSFLGASALRASEDAAASGRWSSAAAQARVAIRWQPWSARPWQRLGEAQAGAGNTAAARASFRRALGASPDDWSIWFDLALASRGRAQRAAARRALALNPHSPEIAESREALPAL